MAVSIPHLREQLAATPIVSPYPHDLAVAIVCDTFRLASQRPPSQAEWAKLEQRVKNPLFHEQVGMLAHVLVSSDLRKKTVLYLTPDRTPQARLQQFFEEIHPLTAEMVRSNAFRQEEFLRKWLAALGADIEGETEAESKRHLKDLDYRQAVTDLRKVEDARKKEADRRKELLQEAARKDAEARGWRE
ncbi:hypothetical protein HMI49_32125 [Corallococcus exercitus]|uniref:Uncharacterized protein n=1 Tax=Corallococcus exercitus TaxID=2316736 RepID=A0A7Y4KQD4_9BACT|nr:hypothetical protein [Corallococcus exercitus]NOK37857.1 hypothetical protein [Corallococcus exercitus]